MPPENPDRPAAVITSRGNARVKQLRAAFAPGSRSKTGLVAVEGDHLIEEALRSGIELDTVFLSQDRSRPAFLPPGTEPLWLSPEVFAGAMETRSPQGVAALLKPRERGFATLLELACPLFLIAARLQDPGNLGTLVRSAEAFGAAAVLTTPGTVDPWNGKALRASAGSLFRTPVLPCGLPQLHLLRDRGVRLLAAVAPGSPGKVTVLTQLDLTGPVAFLVGNEGAGLDPEYLALADALVTIPCLAPIESLNAAVAGSVLLYEASPAEAGKAVSLFDSSPLARAAAVATQAPLAERMRPRTLAEFAGQEQLVGEGRPLRLAIERDDSASLILWGPPGTGKTTLAKIIAEATSASFVEFSAVLSGIREIKQVMAEAEKAADFGSRTILFIDEIHRFNKSQQDAFLPYVERGTIRLIGATTENPSFEINAALLSRCRVYTLVGLTEDQVTGLLGRALADAHRGLGGSGLAAAPGALERIASFASGDVRNALNALEAAAKLAQGREEAVLTIDLVTEAMQRRTLLYDKRGEQHYDLISALHKSVRNSDADAALYWLGRMLAAGEDPMYLARRVVRMAVEDIGLAAPEALNLCLSVRDAMHFLGQPEGDLALAQAVVYLALAPKSNAVYMAWAAVKETIETTAADPVPLHLRNAPTRLMQELSYGKGYQYAHDVEGKVAGMECLPASLAGRRFFHPTSEGRERQLKARMEEIARIRSGKIEES